MPQSRIDLLPPEIIHRIMLFALPINKLDEDGIAYPFRDLTDMESIRGVIFKNGFLWSTGTMHGVFVNYWGPIEDPMLVEHDRYIKNYIPFLYRTGIMRYYVDAI